MRINEIITKEFAPTKTAKSKMALILKKEGHMEGSKIVLSKLGSKRVKKSHKNTSKQLQLI